MKREVGVRGVGAFAPLLAGLACIGCAAAEPRLGVAPAGGDGPGVVAVGLTTTDLARQLALFRGLGFTVMEQVAIDGGVRIGLSLGTERIELTEFETPGRPVPPDSRSDDLWFEHVAIVVSDIDRAWAAARELGIRPISPGPQTIPLANPAAGGIRAVYFRDADGHPLELIWYPPGKGDPRWQATDRLFLGIDHTAIAVEDTVVSLAFWRDSVGLRVAGESLNAGAEQEALSGVAGARVRITGLHGPGAGPGVELLDYLAPDGGRPEPLGATPRDTWHWEIVARTSDPRTACERLARAGSPCVAAADGFRVDDPDGHTLRLIGGER